MAMDTVLRCVVVALYVSVSHSIDVCVTSVQPNNRTASLFGRGTLHRYSSENTYHVNPTPFRKSRCGLHQGSFVPISLVSRRMAQNALDHPHWKTTKNLCQKNELCIITGDELCQVPVDWPFHDRVIMRQFFSSKYPTHGLSLGPRFEFEWVPYPQRLAGNRNYLFSFMGSINDNKPDRMAMQDVVEQYDWGDVQFKWQVFHNYVGQSNNTEDYRETLLQSSFTLSPVGAGDDSFRLWEAVEAGSIPVLVPRNESLHGLAERGDRSCPGAFEDVLQTNPPFIILPSWAELPAFLASQTEADIAARRQELQLWNHEWWTNTTATLDALIRSHPESIVHIN